MGLNSELIATLSETLQRQRNGCVESEGHKPRRFKVLGRNRSDQQAGLSAPSACLAAKLPLADEPQVLLGGGYLLGDTLDLNRVEALPPSKKTSSQHRINIA